MLERVHFSACYMKLFIHSGTWLFTTTHAFKRSRPFRTTADYQLSERAYTDFLLGVISTEVVVARRARYRKARLQLAHLPYLKAFEQYDFSFSAFD